MLPDYKYGRAGRSPLIIYIHLDSEMTISLFVSFATN